MKEKIILIGGGGHCKSCIDVIEKEDKFEIFGVIDIKENVGKQILGYTITGTDDDLEELAKICRNFLITIGQIKSPEKRIKIYNKIQNLNVNLPVIISPLAYVSKHAKIDGGTIVMHNAIVNAGAVIGENCIINTNSLVEHDAIVNNHCHISTGAIVNGGTRIGEGSFFGSGAVSKEYINIASNSFVKANSTVK